MEVKPLEQKLAMLNQHPWNLCRHLTLSNLQQGHIPMLPCFPCMLISPPWRSTSPGGSLQDLTLNQAHVALKPKTVHCQAQGTKHQSAKCGCDNKFAGCTLSNPAMKPELLPGAWKRVHDVGHECLRGTRNANVQAAAALTCQSGLQLQTLASSQPTAKPSKPCVDVMPVILQHQRGTVRSGPSAMKTR